MSEHPTINVFKPDVYPGSKAFHILLALVKGPACGTDINRLILADTLARAYLSRTTLYRELDRLRAYGYVEFVGVHGSEKVLALTFAGRQALEREVRLMMDMTAMARRRLKI